MSAWKEELHNDPDRDFIINGIEHGFDIVDSGIDPPSVELPNHSSCYSKRNRDKVNEQVLKEVDLGNYIPCSSKPIIVSPLGALEKPDGGIRLIHDGSMPPGFALNDYATLTERHKFETVDKLAEMLEPGMFMYKVDLKSAYRSIPISENSMQYTGLKWTVHGKDMYFTDCKLPFGARLSTPIFHRITQAIKRMMIRRGYQLVVYIDDFVGVATTREQCREAMCCLIALLRKLGLLINWQKVVDPTQCITYLGVEVDSVNMCLRLPEEKIDSIREKLELACSRRRLTKRQIQSLVGVLNFAAALVHGGRVFLRRLINASTALKKKSDRAQLRGELLQDILWWKRYMSVFNGKSLILHKRPITSIITDASSEGAGGYCEGDWWYLNWQVDWPQAQKLHINCKETLAVVLSIYRWAPFLANRLVYITSDNTTTVSAINKGSSKSKTVMRALRSLFWISALFNFKLKSVFVPTGQNLMVDCISRLHAKKFREQLHNFVPRTDYRLHMSDASFVLCWLQKQTRQTGLSFWRS